MVLHHLYRAHILVAYAVGGNTVFAAEEVGALNIELVDVLALVLYLAGLLHVDTRHTFEHIANRAVLLLGEASYIIYDSITLLTYAVSLDRNLFKQCSSRFKLNGYRKRNAIERYRLLGEAHH